jgi:2-hydroxy-3-keto-5-methylthiopentenyl-1-phosphate phosphatase
VSYLPPVPEPAAPLAIFVDYDGTITDIDTFDAILRSVAGEEVWQRFEDELAAGRMALRDVLAQQAAMVRMSRDETLVFLEEQARVDPGFAPFVRTAHARGAQVAVVSSGLRQIIGPALERAGVDVPIFANDVSFDAEGWTMTFIDDSANGHDKAARVREARARGAHTVYVGDGPSDFEAALEADRRFAKTNRALERYCQERGVACTSFASFAQIERALFP